MQLNGVEMFANKVSRDVSIVNAPVPGKPQSLLEDLYKQHHESQEATKTLPG